MRASYRVGHPVSVSLENQSTFNMQRKTMIGLDLNYQFNKDFMVGATVMHMSEMPLTVKTTLGDGVYKEYFMGLEYHLIKPRASG